MRTYRHIYIYIHVNMPVYWYTRTYTHPCTPTHTCINHIYIYICVCRFHYYRKELDGMENAEEAHAMRGAHWTFNPQRLIQVIIIMCVMSHLYAWHNSFSYMSFGSSGEFVAKGDYKCVGFFCGSLFVLIGLFWHHWRHQWYLWHRDREYWKGVNALLSLWSLLYVSRDQVIRSIHAYVHIYISISYINIYKLIYMYIYICIYMGI